MIESFILCHVAKNRKRLENGGNVLDMKIKGYLPMGYFLSAHAAGLITNKDVGGGCSYDKKRGAWLVTFPNTSLGLRTAAKLYCGVIKNGYTISSIDALRTAVLDHFKVSHFEDLPDEIMDNAII